MIIQRDLTKLQAEKAAKALLASGAGILAVVVTRQPYTDSYTISIRDTVESRTKDLRYLNA